MGPVVWRSMSVLVRGGVSPRYLFFNEETGKRGNIEIRLRRVFWLGDSRGK